MNIQPLYQLAARLQEVKDVEKNAVCNVLSCTDENDMFQEWFATQFVGQPDGAVHHFASLFQNQNAIPYSAWTANKEQTISNGVAALNANKVERYAKFFTNVANALYQ